MTLHDRDLPDFWAAADRSSLRGQRTTLTLTRLRLGGAVVGATGGAFSIILGSVNLAGLLACAGFGVALVAEVYSWTQAPERDWYVGRAAAESIKTLAWRYAVGGDPFPMALPDERAREVLAERLRDVAKETAEVAAVASLSPSEAMLSLRTSPFDVRRDAYVNGRTRDQARWYAAKANSNRASARNWFAATVILEVGGLLLALARGLGFFEIDLAGVLAALVAAAVAWVALKQHSNLATAYAIAASELAFQCERLLGVAEEQWPEAVADAEEAISREHTLWLASRTGKINWKAL